MRKPSVSLLWSLWLLLNAATCLAAQPTSAAVEAFNAYSARVEERLLRQHQSKSAFLAPLAPGMANSKERLRSGGLAMEHVLEPDTAQGADLAGAMLHHWRGTAFAPGATAADFERLMRGFNAYPQHFAPEVIHAGASPQPNGHLSAWMRIRQRHVITVVMDTAYDVTFGQLDQRHGYSISRSTRIEEVAFPGSRNERALSAAEEHGFLWRLNTYWSYEERDGGLYLQIEAVSLTRSVPTGFGWMVGPYVESIPRESLEFTLRSACQAIEK